MSSVCRRPGYSYQHCCRICAIQPHFACEHFSDRLDQHLWALILQHKTCADARDVALRDYQRNDRVSVPPATKIRMRSCVGGNNEGIPSFFGGRRPQILGGYRGRSVCLRWGVGVTQATHAWQRSGRARRCCVPRASPSGESGGCQLSSGSRRACRRPAGWSCPR
jgi:hypothetical protein